MQNRVRNEIDFGDKIDVVFSVEYVQEQSESSISCNLLLLRLYFSHRNFY